MKKLVLDLVNRLNLPEVQFADVRFTQTDSQSIYFEKGSLKGLSTQSDSPSLGIRVLVNGSWGFAGTNRLDKKSVDTALKTALDNARHGSRFRHTPVKLAPVKPTVGTYNFKPLRDPFLMSNEEKLDYFRKIAQALEGNTAIVYSYVHCAFYRQYKVYANSEGTCTDSLVYDTRPSMQVLAAGDGHVYSRNYPGDMAGKRGGFEVVEDLDMPAHTDEIVNDAIALIKAPTITEERADLIIGNSHLALQLHESVGHATEADRLFGMEISYAGKTFVKPSMLGKHRYGSPVVNIYSDSADPAGMGYHPVDDEGVPGQRVDIIKDGILVNLQTSRETAPLLGLAPSSNMVASYGADIPLIRMTSFCLAPGKAGSLKDLIASTEHGYLVDYTKTWSIDDNRNNFQFTTQIGWRIDEGRITGVVKEPTYYGITTEFWNSCDAVCSAEEWRYHGTFFCGKGEPGQAMHLSHGVAPARFKNVVCNVKA